MDANFKQLDEKELEQVAGGAGGLVGKLWKEVWQEEGYICWSFVGGDNDYPDREEHYYNGECTGTSRLARYGTIRQVYRGSGTYGMNLIFADGTEKMHTYEAK